MASDKPDADAGMSGAKSEQAQAGSDKLGRDGHRSGASARSADREQPLAEQLQRANARLDAVLEELASTREDLKRSRVALRLANADQNLLRSSHVDGVGLWEWNTETDETWWSPLAYQLWDLAPGEKPPPLDERRIHPDDRAAYAAACEAARAAGELGIEWRVVLRDGSVRWLAEAGHRDGQGGTGRMLGVIQDVTLRKQTEARLTTLSGELQHRVRSMLGLVRSVVARSARAALTVEDLSAALDGRLSTLARIQGMFTRATANSVDLEEVVRDEMVAAAVREERLTIEGPHIQLKREAAEVFALALHELTTNAVKYGALSEPAGMLSVTWRVLNSSAGLTLALEWRERGVRALDLRPSRCGFGLDLIERGLPQELGATTALTFAPGGVRAMIEAPMADRIVEASPTD